MIYITGDTHSNFIRFNEDNFPVQEEMTKDDYVIICGDFGGVWTFEEESNREKEALNWLNNKKFTTLFVDGNHENFTRLYNYPVEEWHGGKVHKIRESVLHLMRGEIFDINNKKFFAFGGAKSHDIQDGILNLSYKKDILTDYLQEVSEKCEFRKWYFGHYHDNRQINSQFALLYNDIVPLEFESIF